MSQQEKEVVQGAVEWKIKVGDDDDDNHSPASSSLLLLSSMMVACIWGAILGVGMKVCKFMKKAWQMGLDDPRKFIHGLKVGVALSAVSFFYYMKPLYEGVGGNSMWAVMTVVVVFEYTAGATICKVINRICGTSLAGFLAIGVHWLANKAGEQWGPMIAGVFLFLFASAITFSRFIPSIKARFDYGCLIFILTFSLVAVSGYRVEKLLDLAQQRVSTVIIGTCLCMIVSMTICPIWAGQELHLLVTKNLDKLANSLQEETMANLARWEPAHGRFNFRHPWKQYVKVGASMRTCASCLDALIACINSHNQAPDHIKNKISGISVKLGSKCANVIKEVATTMRNMTKSSKVDVLIMEMNDAAQELRDLLNNSHSNNLLIIPQKPSTTTNEEDEEIVGSVVELNMMMIPAVMEIIQVVTVASLLIETVSRVEDIVKAVDELSNLAKFKEPKCVKDNKIHPTKQQNHHDDDHEAANNNDNKTLQMV
ncbi:aluminum-activated malate transporter 10-like [Arachis duranensis]|uniref:Aluminum-activated malate transporter 10-like n=1 Tax=Arachis duranensis TaxID=130453 RepID=A0A9C6WLH1_ARADU|nr:aluminum-activated malate transporter 10-like [Arachis duranensis]